MERTRLYLKIAAIAPVKIIDIYFKRQGTSQRMKEFRDTFGQCDEKVTVWNITGKKDSQTARMFRSRKCSFVRQYYARNDKLLYRSTGISRQENPICYVLITDEELWDQNAFWTQIVQEDCVQNAHVLRYRYIAPSDHTRSRYNKALGAIYQDEPTYCLYIPGPAPLVADQGCEIAFPKKPASSSEAQICVDADEEESIAPDAHGNGHEESAQSFTDYGVDQEEDIKSENRLCTCGGVVDKPDRMKGDDFLSFMERALAIYEKV